jgi:hypothetical protein
VYFFYLAYSYFLGVPYFVFKLSRICYKVLSFELSGLGYGVHSFDTVDLELFITDSDPSFYFLL